MAGLFGNICDLDRNGELNSAEQALEMLLFDVLTEDGECSGSDSDWD